MEEKILFWIDEGLIDFCVAKSIETQKDYEKFAIIEIGNGREFFENQEFVSFKKTWYFRDCFTNLNFKPNLEYLKNFEKKYDINLWQIIFSDITFNQYNKYYKFSKLEILKILELECKYFEKIIDEINPEYLVMRFTDRSHTQILQKICKSKKINVLTLGFTRLGIRANISQEYDTLDLNQKQFDKNESLSKKQINKIESFEDVKKYVSQYSIKQKEFKKKFQNSKINWFIAGLKYLKLTLNSNHIKYYMFYGHSIWNTVFNEISFVINAKKRFSFIEKNLIKKIPQNWKFVYFPLQLDPERTILIPAPFFSIQKDVIINIAKSLPVNYKLIVKEHPLQRVRGWRPISFYKEIKNLPNVEFVHPHIENEEMIKKCSIVATITGTSGLEAAINKKPSIVFADTIYSELPSVFKITTIEQLPQIIQTALKTDVSMDDVKKFIFKIESNSFEHDQSGLNLLMYKKFFYDGYLFNTKILNSDMNEFLEENHLQFEELAKKFIEKMDRG
ncbi:capsular biosynthesis protein [Nitrosopumilus sp.]|jgi:hypothetical protein|nr:capsular biosynthesis protein [Nitrosopumilus sp.]